VCLNFLEIVLADYDFRALCRDNIPVIATTANKAPRRMF